MIVIASGQDIGSLREWRRLLDLIWVIARECLFSLLHEVYNVIIKNRANESHSTSSLSPGAFSFE